MGACECENPMEFGYEVNAEEKDVRQSETNNFISQSNYAINNIESNYPNTMSNLISTDSNKGKINLKKNINQQQNYESQEFQEHQENQLHQENQEREEFQEHEEGEEEQQDNEDIPEDKDSQKNEENQENENQENQENQEGQENQENQENQNNNQINQVEKKEKKLEGVEALRARFENDNYPNDSQSENKMPPFIPQPINEPVDEFSKYIYENLNQIRENPQSFIPIIEKAKENIVNDKKGICIYKSSVKVALYKGKPAFDETIQFLKKTKPMKKLSFKSDLMVTPPKNEYEIQDKTYMNEMINLKVQQGIPIKSFWRDIIKDSETCLILMIVDDTGANSGKKRFDVLDPSMENIGIISKKIGKYFASYLILS